MEGSAPAQRIGFQLEKIVNELEQLQKQIAKRESGMQTIFSAMQDALLVVDSNRQVILTNQTFRKLFDAPEISVATPLLEIVRDPTLDRLLTDAFRGDGPVRCELALDGSQIELHAVATRNESGEITGALVLFHDITELKKMDQVRRDFVANVSHELRTPLSILRGYIETLLDSSENSARGAHPNSPHNGAPFGSARVARRRFAYARAIGIRQSEFADGNGGSVEFSSGNGSRLGKETHKKTAQHRLSMFRPTCRRFTLIARGYRKPSTICSKTP